MFSSQCINFCLLIQRYHVFCFFFFFNDTATTEIYTLSLHDALPISWVPSQSAAERRSSAIVLQHRPSAMTARSEEHTSELQSQSNLVCRLLLEKKKKNKQRQLTATHITTPVVPYSGC